MKGRQFSVLSFQFSVPESRISRFEGSNPERPEVESSRLEAHRLITEN
jgi:hypothetical protein